MATNERLLWLVAWLAFIWLLDLQDQRPPICYKNWKEILFAIETIIQFICSDTNIAVPKEDVCGWLNEWFKVQHFSVCSWAYSTMYWILVWTMNLVQIFRKLDKFDTIYYLENPWVCTKLWWADEQWFCKTWQYYILNILILQYSLL